MATHTLFYSWQSDLPNSTNRGFIEDCLERAIKKVRADEELTLDPCLDRDTIGVPGSPDIATTIFDKINGADVFVGDVSFIAQSATERSCPNPNVLIELGYAAGCLGWDKIICVFNKMTGSLNDLPFDIRPRRIMAYELVEGQEKAEQRRILVSLLRAGIIGILHAPDKAELEALTHLLSSVAAEVIPIIISGDEYEDRKLSDGIKSIRFQFGHSAEQVRNIAMTDAAIRNDMANELNDLADDLDGAANIGLTSGSWPQFEDLIKSAVAKANAIKATRINVVPLSEDSLSQVRDLIITTQRKLVGFCQRMENMIQQGRLKDVKAEASEFGYGLFRVGHHQIDFIHAGLGEKVKTVGRNLHLVDAMHVYADGGKSVEAIIDRIQKNSAELAEIVKTLS